MSSSINEVFQMQKIHQHNLSQSSVKERIHKIQSIIEYLRENKNELHRVMYQDLRRDGVDIDAEWLMVKGEADFAVKNLHKWIKPHKVKNSLMTMGTKSYYQYEPKGTILIMTPWNAPLAIPLVPLIGAIAAGNSVILKPSELSPATSSFIGRMLKELFSEKEVAVFEGDEKIASTLLMLPFNHIFFTGGAEIGKLVMKAAADNLVPLTLELGGKNPVIIDETADLENTARKIAWGKCANCGQACVAPDYILVHHSVHDRLVNLLKEELIKMYNAGGAGFQKSEEYARIINQKHFDRIKSLYDDVVLKGAQVIIGGEFDRSDNFIAPAVLTGISDNMNIMRNEIFGPLLAVKSYGKPQEAIDYIRGMEKPLSLYIYSRNKSSINYFLSHTTSGNTVINHNMIQAGINPHLPFGGTESSGTGRIVGKATFKAFSNERSIVHQPLGFLDFSTFSFPPYSGTYKKVLGKLAK